MGGKDELDVPSVEPSTNVSGPETPPSTPPTAEAGIPHAAHTAPDTQNAAAGREHADGANEPNVLPVEPVAPAVEPAEGTPVSTNPVADARSLRFTSPAPTAPGDEEERQSDLVWALLGGFVLPFFGSVLIRGGRGGWGWGVIDAPNLAFCFVTLSLTLLVRMLGYRSSRRFMSGAISLLVIQVMCAWQLSGAFDPRPNNSEIDAGIVYLEHQQTALGSLTSQQAQQNYNLQEFLISLQHENRPNGTFLFYTVVFGAVTLLAMLILWRPRASGRRRDGR